MTVAKRLGLEANLDSIEGYCYGIQTNDHF